MQIVIDIPEDVYEDIVAHNGENREGGKSAYYFEGLIQNGTPLPKGHGRLIDAEELYNDLKERQKSYEHNSGIRQLIDEAVKDGIIIARSHIDYAPTIIEADKGE
jgi:hypothetical protein